MSSVLSCEPVSYHEFSSPTPSDDERKTYLAYLKATYKLDRRLAQVEPNQPSQVSTPCTCSDVDSCKASIASTGRSTSTSIYTAEDDPCPSICSEESKFQLDLGPSFSIGANEALKAVIDSFSPPASVVIQRHEDDFIFNHLKIEAYFRKHYPKGFHLTGRRAGRRHRQRGPKPFRLRTVLKVTALSVFAPMLAIPMGIAYGAHRLARYL